MNKEKMQVLFNAMVVAAEELKSATKAANSIKIDNEKEQKITKIVRSFKVVEKNHQGIEDASTAAVERLEKYSMFPKLLNYILILVVSAIIGLAGGYYIFSTHLSDIAYQKHLEKKFGIVVHENGLQLPIDYADRIGRTPSGMIFITAKD